MTTEGEQLVSRFFLGSVLLGLSALLMIPCALGLAEYSNNDAVPSTNSENKKKNDKKRKAYGIIQTTVLAIAIFGFFSGGAIMIVAAKSGAGAAAQGNTLVTKVHKPSKHKIGGVAGTKKLPAVGIRTGGRSGGRSLEEFELF